MKSLPVEFTRRFAGSPAGLLLKRAAEAIPKTTKLQPEHVTSQLLRESQSLDDAVDRDLKRLADAHQEAFDGSPGTRLSHRLVGVLEVLAARAGDRPLTEDLLFDVILSSSEPYAVVCRGPIARAREVRSSRQEREQRRLRIQASAGLAVISKLGDDLLRSALDGGFDRAVERDVEIERMKDSFAASSSTNVLLVGPSGVGKAAIVHELAARIADGRETLRPDDFWLFGMTSGRLVEDDPQTRAAWLNAIADESKAARHRSRPTNPVLFVRWLYHLADSAGDDRLTALNDTLSDGAIRMVATTDRPGLDRLKQRSRKLVDRFRVIEIEEPDTDAAVRMALANIDKFEVHHRVSITKEAAQAAVELVVRENAGVRPRAAIDLVDHAASALKLRGDASAKGLVVDADVIRRTWPAWIAGGANVGGHVDVTARE